MRGVPENSFKKLAEKIKELKEKGVHASIQIDPEAFEKHNITAIPATVLTKGEIHDQITGNIPLIEALRFFSESGELTKEARSLLAKATDLERGRRG